MTTTLKCLPLTGVSDGPYMLEPAGTLTALQNMRIRPGGYAEAKGGMEKLKPSGGTPAEPGGSTVNAIQVNTSNGWIRSFATAGSVWSGNLQFSEGNYLPFPAGAVNDAWYFGADAPFARIGAKFQIYANWTVTHAYEYWNGAAWTALTTQETFTWTLPLPVTSTSIDSYASWQMPSDWAATVVGNTSFGNILKYWMRVRIATSTVITTLPTVGKALGAWFGIRELYLAGQSPFGPGPVGNIQRYDQSTVAGTVQYFSCNTSGMYSSQDPSVALAAYKGRVYATNPKESVKWDGTVLQNIGNIRAGAGTCAQVVIAGTAGIWRYYLAWGYGPLQNESNADGNAGYREPLYGVGRATQTTPGVGADPLDANSVVTTAPNGQVQVGWAAITIPANASALVIYRTPDLTNVAVAKRGLVPADAIFCLNRSTFTTSTTMTDSPGVQPIIAGAPPATLYDNLPPPGCRYAFVFENRLLIGGGPEGTWYWSDPFLPDQFNRAFQFLSLTRALGGRDMGGCEFAGWGVLHTEDQTWGIQNLDQDVFTLIPIHSGVGSVAPFATAVGDGVLIQLAKDGFYLWDGSKAGPRNISGKFKHTFAKMSYEAHGGSRGAINDHKYEVTLIDGKNGTVGAAYTLDLQTLDWANRTTNDKKVPICTIHAPLGHSDAGVPHILYAKATVGTSSATDATSYSPCIGDYTTQDDGTNYVCSATAHFALPPGATFSPKRAIAYYQAADGWGTPSLAAAASDVGQGSVGTITTNTPDTGTDYSLVAGDYSQQSSGTSDLKVTFSVTGTGGGTVGAQRLFGLILEGEPGGLRDGT